MTEETKPIDPIALDIISYLESGAEPNFQEMAKVVFEPRRKQKDSDNAWRRYLQAVKQQALFLARQGKIEIVRKGEVVDPSDFKGLVKLRIKK